MKLEKFAAATSEHAAAHQRAMTVEQRRKLLHDAWLADVYPHWQGPIAIIAKEPGIASVYQSPSHGFPNASNGPEVARDVAAAEGRSLDWPVGEVIRVDARAEIGVGAAVLYALAGDENDCVAVRAVAFHDAGMIWPTIDGSRIATWTGSLDVVVAEMADDVARAAALVDDMLLAALGARQARIADEKRQAEEAERERVAAETKAKADEEGRRRQLEQAALEESRRLEAARKADEALTPGPRGAEMLEAESRKKTEAGMATAIVRNESE